MNSKNYQFLIAEDGIRCQTRKQLFGTADIVEVRDLSTRTMLKIKACEVSLYRHTLYLNGKPFRILNVVAHA